MNRMTELFDDRIADWLEDDPLQAPPQVLQTVLAAVPSVPQRRAGLAWQPASLGRPWQLAAAAVGVLLVSILGLLVLRGPSIGPIPSPSGQAPSATAAPSPSPGPSPTARQTSGASASITPVAPIPDDLIGAWYHPAPAWWWFLRAGDPECTEAAATQLDCVYFRRGNLQPELGTAAVVAGDLHVEWRSGFCAGIHSDYGIGRDGDTLNLIEREGGCQGGDLVLTRAGTGTAPTAEPRPTP